MLCGREVLVGTEEGLFETPSAYPGQRSIGKLQEP